MIFFSATVFILKNQEHLDVAELISHVDDTVGWLTWWIINILDLIW